MAGGVYEEFHAEFLDQGLVFVFAVAGVDGGAHRRDCTRG
jgi:hypothetical protein